MGLTARNALFAPARVAAGPFVRRRLRRPVAGLVALAGLVLLGACSHYRLGSGARPTFATLHVATATVGTLVPQAQALVSTQVREAFLRDGRVTLANSPAQADATLQIRLTGCDREVAVSRADDTGLARRFNQHLRATCTLVDRRTGKTLFADRAIEAARGVFTDSGQLQAEYQALPLLAQDLAGRIVHAVLDVW